MIHSSQGIALNNITLSELLYSQFPINVCQKHLAIPVWMMHLRTALLVVNATSLATPRNPSGLLPAIILSFT